MMQSASLSKRTLAFIVDMFFIAMLNFFAVNLLDTSAVRVVFSTPGAISFGVDLLFPLILLLYYFLLELLLRRSPGKIAMGLRIVSGESGPYTISTVLLRNLAKVVSYFLLIGFIVALFHSQRLALHDLFARTRVINEEESVEPAQG